MAISFADIVKNIAATQPQRDTSVGYLPEQTHPNSWITPSPYIHYNNNFMIPVQNQLNPIFPDVMPGNFNQQYNNDIGYLPSKQPLLSPEEKAERAFAAAKPVNRKPNG